MIETPSVARRQSSTDKRSPENNSTFLPPEDPRRTFRKRSSRLEGRTKQRRFVNPCSSSVSTTLAPMNPLDPVINIRSLEETVYSTLIDLVSSRNNRLFSPITNGPLKSCLLHPSHNPILNNIND